MQSDTLFQSTLPQGEWQLQSRGDYILDYISIHTPARGVTKICRIHFQFCQFQSTLPQGEWPRQIIQEHCIWPFQSTLPQGEWRLTFPVVLQPCPFQSTLPQGEWRRSYPIAKQVANFNPHSRKGSDYPRNFYICISRRFQSTLPQGEWQQFLPIITFQFCHYLLK